MNTTVVELVLLKLKAGVADAEFMAASASIQPRLAGMPGYVKRELYKNDAGQWVDMVWWRSMDDALSAMEVMNTAPEMASFGGLIDFANTTMLHLNAAGAWN